MNQIIKYSLVTIANIVITTAIVFGLFWYFSVFSDDEPVVVKTIPEVVQDVLLSVVSITVTADIPGVSRS